MHLKICSRCNLLLQKLHAIGLNYPRSRTTWNARAFSAKTKEISRENNWQPVIGLEIHAQIKSNSKLFSRAGNRFMAPPNSLVSEFDAALPGTLPVLNRRCVESAVLSALALRCTINKRSYFDRKHYFYADLPQGYQITQQRKPIAVDGHVLIPARDGGTGDYYWKKINIIQIQLEQDSGKSLHDEIGGASLVDLNRAGVGLMEIVTSPDFASAEEVLTFILDLQLTLRKLGTCEGKITEGNIRVDANISLHQPGEPLGVRSEVKNVAGLKSLQQAIDYEISRQKRVLDAGEEVVNETREFDAEKGITISMRDKEVLQDYRFIPEPNLPPLVLYDDRTLPKTGSLKSFINIDEIRRKLPDQLPTDVRVSLMKDYKLDLLEASFLLEYRLADYFLEVMRCGPTLPVATVVNWLKINLLGLMNEKDVEADDSPVSPAQMAELISLLDAHEVNTDLAHETFMIVAEVGGSPTEVIDAKGWRMINDVEVIADLVKRALDDMDVNRLLKSYIAGKHKRSRNKNAVASVVSAVMKLSDNKAHTSIVKKVVKKVLDERSLSK